LDVDSIEVFEVGPREGFQFEGIGAPDRISTDDKLRLISALTSTGVRSIETASFVSPKAVPQMADADEISARLPVVEGVQYMAVYLNGRGLERAIAAGRYAIDGRLILTASETFLKLNQRRTQVEDLAAQREMAAIYQAAGVPVESGGLMAAFGCNYEGDVPLSRVLQLVGQMHDICTEVGSQLKRVLLADTMGWADPLSIRRTVDAVRDRWPDLVVSLHLHDTRGTGMANIYAGLESGVTRFDTSVGGLGGCPFAKVAAGNVPTEDVVFMAERMGIETGIDLAAMVECAKLAQEIVGHPLPSRMLAAGVGLVRT